MDEPIKKKKVLHKYDIIKDICKICGVRKRKISIVGCGYNKRLIHMYYQEYSTDGIHWQREYINCKKNI